MTSAQKIPFTASQNDFARKKIGEALQLTGKALPCRVVSAYGATNSIYTVEFDLNAAPFTLPQVTVPLFGPEWVRYPIRQGTRGVVFPVDARIGAITGLGSGTPTLARPANLSALVFFPIGSTTFSDTDDPDKLVLYGPNGVVIRDADKNCTIDVGTEEITVTGKTKVTIKVGDITAVIDEDGFTATAGSASITLTDGAIDLEGALTINGQPYLDHLHSGVDSGSDNTGGVVP